MYYVDVITFHYESRHVGAFKLSKSLYLLLRNVESGYKLGPFRIDQFWCFDFL